MRIVRVRPGSELADLLDTAGSGPLLLEKDGVRYRLDRERGDIWADYDPLAALAGIRAAGGSWRDINAESVKEALHHARETGTRPPSRP